MAAEAATATPITRARVSIRMRRSMTAKAAAAQELKYTGLVHVIGDDHFDLDAHNDGVACES